MKDWQILGECQEYELIPEKQNMENYILNRITTSLDVLVIRHIYDFVWIIYFIFGYYSKIYI